MGVRINKLLTRNPNSYSVYNVLMAMAAQKDCRYQRFSLIGTAEIFHLISFCEGFISRSSLFNHIDPDFQDIDYVTQLDRLVSATSVQWNATCDVTPDQMCVSFCCRQDADRTVNIVLPKSVPFVLFKVRDHGVATLCSLNFWLHVSVERQSSKNFAFSII